jgi:hypothetical protein
MGFLSHPLVIDLEQLQTNLSKIWRDSYAIQFISRPLLSCLHSL